MKFMGREIDEGIYVYAAASAAVVTSVYLFYKFVWQKQQQSPPPLPMSNEYIDYMRNRNMVDIYREP